MSGLPCSQYGVLQPQLAGLDALVLEDLEDRVDLRDVEPAAGLDEPGDDPCPAADVGQPAEDAARRVDDVELVPETDRQLVHVRLDEARVEPEVRRQLARERDRGRREVDAGDLRAEPRPRQRVEPEMALQVEQRLAGHVAEGRDLVGLDPDAALAEAGDVVEVALGVQLRPRVPQALVGGERRLEVDRVSHLTAPTRTRRRAPGRRSGRTRPSARPARGSTASPPGAGRRAPPRGDRSSGRRRHRARRPGWPRRP